MEKIIFTEEQKFDQVWIRAIMLISWIPLLAIFGIGFYQQIILGKQWGNHPMSDTGLLITTALVFMIMAGATWLTFSIRLVTEVTHEGLRYRFPPLMLRFRTIPKHDIAEYNIRQYNPVREYGGWGIRQGGFGKTGIAYNVKGNTGLQLQLKNGKKILFGTQRPDALRAAMDKLMNPPLL
jgi:hypothetical protein